MHDIRQFGIPIEAGRKGRSVSLAQSRNKGVSVFLADRPVAIAVTVIESRLFHDTCPRDDTSYAAMMDWFRFATRATSRSVERPFRGRNVLDVLDPRVGGVNFQDGASAP